MVKFKPIGIQFIQYKPGVKQEQKETNRNNKIYQNKTGNNYNIEHTTQWIMTCM